MKISIGADHGAIHLRTAVATFLKEQGHEVIDHGTFSTESVDYPDFATQVGLDVVNGRADFGVLMCTSGIGISISANKINGVRAALVHNEDGAEFSRRHNNANIICFGEKYQTPYLVARYLSIFLATPFEGGRHERRINKIGSIEQSESGNGHRC